MHDVISFQSCMRGPTCDHLWCVCLCMSLCMCVYAHVYVNMYLSVGCRSSNNVTMIYPCNSPADTSVHTILPNMVNVLYTKQGSYNKWVHYLTISCTSIYTLTMPQCGPTIVQPLWRIGELAAILVNNGSISGQ